MSVSGTPVAATPGAHDPDGQDRIFTIPNVISLIRLLCLPLFLYLLFGKDEPLAASILLGALGGTDWIDGYIARHYHQVSELGKILDPVADRLLFFVGIGGIWIYGAVPGWFAGMVLLREIVVAVTTVVLAAMGARRVDVTWWGKAGTFALMIAFPMFLASSADFWLADQARFLAWGFGLPGLALSYVSWAMYLPLGLKALAEGRADRAASETAQA
ncbi:CDP-alcohol phosphatidyltransferase family protein [Aquihabitans sp. McL0605]|uniref:CDP-alcohol phosphatidyltransferase family protein n=1 Tax=Aquihabitans sp. McL0605 TaxID=3415671 RepID=UPI003CEF7611